MIVSRLSLSLLIILSLTSVVAADSDLSNLDYSISGDQVMGRSHTTTFEYNVNVDYRPVDTAIVIDESGSMSGQMSAVKSAAKDYVDSTRTGDGDENAVVEFASSASTIQSLTSNKQDAKNAIDSISAGGGTDLPAGVSEGHSALNSGSNGQQVMIVLADGGGGDPGNEADQARADGIEVHGIMYGSGASTSEFGSLTNSNCQTSSSENSDGDNCWYAESGTIDQVYESIREETDTQRSAELHAVMPEHARSFDRDPDNIQSDGQREYVINNLNTEDGSHTVDFEWYPTSYGDNVQMKTGDSYIEFTEEGDTTNYYFDQTQNNQIDYVDFNVFNSSITRKDGQINVSVSVRNDGTTGSRETDFEIYDESGNKITDILPVLPSGEEKKYSYTLDEPHPVFNNPEMIRAKADASGMWGSDGKELEPDEGDNIRKMGFPALISDTSPDNLEYDDTFAEQIDVEHPEYSSLSGTYDFFIGPNKFYQDTETEEDVDYTSTDSTFSTEQYTVDRVEAYYNFTNTLADTYGSTSVFNYSEFVENTPPAVFNPDPEDGTIITGDDDQSVYVSVISSDLENESLTIYYFDETDKLIQKQDISDGERTSVLYPGTTVGESYDWYVKVSDGFENYTSNDYTFTKTTAASYRTQPRIEYDYSSIIMGESDTRDIFLVMENQIDEPKNLKTYLSGVNATFGENNQDSIEYELDRYSERRFMIQIRPESVGSKTLEVITENQDFGVNTTTSIPVTVKNYQDVSAISEVSGIGTIQLLMLLLVSVYLYSVRL